MTGASAYPSVVWPIMATGRTGLTRRPYHGSSPPHSAREVREGGDGRAIDTRAGFPAPWTDLGALVKGDAPSASRPPSPSVPPRTHRPRTLAVRAASGKPGPSPQANKLRRVASRRSPGRPGYDQWAGWVRSRPGLPALLLYVEISLTPRGVSDQEASLRTGGSRWRSRSNTRVALSAGPPPRSVCGVAPGRELWWTS